MKISKPAINLFSMLLRSDPRRRLSWEEFFAHPFITQDKKNSSSENTLNIKSESSEDGEGNPFQKYVGSSESEEEVKLEGLSSKSKVKKREINPTSSDDE